MLGRKSFPVAFKTNSTEFACGIMAGLTDRNHNRFNRRKGRKKRIQHQFGRMFDQFWRSILNHFAEISQISA